MLILANRNDQLHVRSSVAHDLTQTASSLHGWTLAFAENPNLGLFASGGRDTAIRIWGRGINSAGNPYLNAPVTLHSDSAVRGLAFNLQTNELASAHENGTINVWNPHTLQKIRHIVGHGQRAYGLAYINQGTQLVSVGGDGKIKLWDAVNGSLLKDIGTHAGAVYALELLPDGKGFITTGEDGLIKHWSTSTHQLIETWIAAENTPLYALAISANGNIIAGDGQGYIYWWDFDSNRASSLRNPTQKFHVSGSGKIHALAFHPYTQQFSATSEDALWRLWDRSSTSPIRTQSLLDSYQAPYIPPDTTQQSAKQLVKLAFRGIQPVFNARILLEQPKTLEPYFLAGFLTATDVHCPEGGTFSYTLTDVDSDRLFATASDMFSATVDACEDTRYLMDGAYTLTLDSTTRNQRMPVTPTQSVLDATLTQLKIGAGDEDNTLSGHLHFVDTEADPSQIAPSSVLQTSSTDLSIDLLNQGTILFSNLNSSLSEETITEVQQLDYQATLALNGNSNSGTYRLATPEKLILDPAAQYPAHGKLTINGLSGNNALMQITVTVLDVDKVKIETDKTGNGSIDYQETVNWSELTTPFGR